jgi:hypothetical protein
MRMNALTFCLVSEYLFKQNRPNHRNFERNPHTYFYTHVQKKELLLSFFRSSVHQIHTVLVITLLHTYEMMHARCMEIHLYFFYIHIGTTQRQNFKQVVSDYFEDMTR